jgi:hypothetical protein
LESLDQKKEKLNNQIEEATSALHNQVGEYKSQVKNAALIGGILLAAYAISQLFDDKEEPIPSALDSKPEKGSFLSSAIGGMALSVALQFAKNQLLEYLEKTHD